LIEVRFEKKAGVTAGWVRRIVSGTLKAEKKAMPMSVLITGDRQIRAINKRYLKHDYATDVVSFDTGDLVVSADFAKKYAKEHGLPFRQELARYLVHGTLHLLGYDDRRKKDHERMHRRQEALLRKML
jgi:probable rRNA maturation factor